MSNLTTEFMIAFVKMQSELPVVGKPATGSTGKGTYQYATLRHVCDKLYPILTAHGFGVSQVLDNFEGRPSVRMVMMHTSGGYIEGNYPIQAAGMKTAANNAQQFGAAIQYTRRYGLLSITGTPTDDQDSDSIGPDEQGDEQQPVDNRGFEQRGRNPRDDMNSRNSYTPGQKSEKPKDLPDHEAKEITAKKEYTCLICGHKGEEGSQLAFKREGGKPYIAHWGCHIDTELAREK